MLRDVLGDINRTIATIADTAEAQASLARQVNDDVQDVAGKVEVVAHSVDRMSGEVGSISTYMDDANKAIHAAANDARTVNNVAAKSLIQPVRWTIARRNWARFPTSCRNPPAASRLREPGRDRLKVFVQPVAEKTAPTG